jgi:hypothetical protein
MRHNYIFYNIPPATLQTWLTEAQKALFDLTVGGKVQTVAYTQGDGSKSVAYTKADVGQLTEYIQELVAALTNRRRRAIGVGF